MKLSFEELRKADNHTYNLDLDLSNIRIDDALIKQINEVKLGHVLVTFFLLISKKLS